MPQLQCPAQDGPINEDPYGEGFVSCRHCGCRYHRPCADLFARDCYGCHAPLVMSSQAVSPPAHLRPTAPVGTTFRLPPPPPPPPPRSRSSARFVIALVILVAVILAVIVAKNSSTGSKQSSNPSVQPSPTGAPVVALPADSEALPASGYIQALDARITQLNFYESGAQPVPKDARIYSSTFEHDSVRFVNWELNLQHPIRSARQDFVIFVYLYNADGSLRAQQQTPSYIEPSWTNSFHSNRWGLESGEWQPGTYRASFFVDGLKVGAGSFLINAPPSPAITETPEEPEDSDVAPPVENQPEPAAAAPVPKRPPTVEDCQKERRLRSLRTLDSIEQWTLDQVKGSCAALNMPLEGAESEWRRFGENRGGSQTNESSSVEEARLVMRVAPSYPALAKQTRVQGVVRLSATVGLDGKLHGIRVVSGSPLLAGAAVAAAFQWRYTPARLHGTPIESPATIEMNFTLDGR